MARSGDIIVAKSLIDTIRDIKRPHAIPNSGWQAVGSSFAAPFESTWGNAGVVAGTTNAPAGYYLSDDGEVRLRGKVDGGAVGSTIFTLPEELRPEYAETFICAVDGGQKANITVHADGRVILDSLST